MTPHLTRRAKPAPIGTTSIAKRLPSTTQAIISTSTGWVQALNLCTMTAWETTSNLWITFNGANLATRSGLQGTVWTEFRQIRVQAGTIIGIYWRAAVAVTSLITGTTGRRMTTRTIRSTESPLLNRGGNPAWGKSLVSSSSTAATTRTTSYPRPLPPRHTRTRITISISVRLQTTIPRQPQPDPSLTTRSSILLLRPTDPRLIRTKETTTTTTDSRPALPISTATSLTQISKTTAVLLLTRAPWAPLQNLLSTQRMHPTRKDPSIRTHRHLGTNIIVSPVNTRLNRQLRGPARASSQMTSPVSIRRTTTLSRERRAPPVPTRQLHLPPTPTTTSPSPLGPANSKS